MLPEHNHPEVSAIVAAHPDDEILWFSSVLADAAKVILCFEDVPGNSRWSEGRRASVSQYPLPQLVNLRLPEADVFHAIDWSAPSPSFNGLEIPGNGDAGTTYAENYLRMVELLRAELQDCRHIFTHSPWGEYGNAEHIQVFRAVTAAVKDTGSTIWVPGYFSNVSADLMAATEDQLGSDVITLPTNPSLATEIAAIYKANGCWTWYEDYAWPQTESFRQASGKSQLAGALWPLNRIRVAPPAPTRQRPGLAKRVQKRLLRLLGRTEPNRGA